LKIKLLFSILTLLITTHLSAAPSFKTYDIAVPLTKQGAVVEATNKFMATKIGKSYKGSLHLNSYLANGMNPATHSFVLLMDSMADIAEWENGLAGNPDIMEFWSTLEANSTPVSEYMGSLIKTWGDISNNDRIWQVTRFYSTDPATMVASMDALIAKTGKKFPGQTAIHALGIGNRNGANNSFSTHMLVNGYESVAEMEEWMNYLNTQPAWGEFLGAVRSSTTWQGSDLIQNAVIYDDNMDLEEFLD
tara:strand:+ start:125 stop:868 length:744 start_codon:yes stop_codon:yes gene_type:complete